MVHTLGITAVGRLFPKTRLPSIGQEKEYNIKALALFSDLEFTSVFLEAMIDRLDRYLIIKDL